MALDSTWVVLVAGCGVMGLAIWGGMNAMTLKTILLWLFIGFGFLTFLMHLFGSPISILLGKIFKTADGNCNQLQGRFSDAEVDAKRQRILNMKQFLQDDKVKIYKENVLAPREESFRAKRAAEFKRFNGSWKGKGQKIRGNGIEEAQHNYLSQDFLREDATHPEEESEIAESENERETREGPVAVSGHMQTETECYQRRNRHTFELAEEPKHTEKGVLTVALRCPDGTVKKRRFTKESPVKMLFAFVEWLGYSPSSHVILTTYPRRQLSDATQTFTEAGLTHDTALVLEEI